MERPIPTLQGTIQLVYCSVYSFRQLTKPAKLMYGFYYKSLSKTVVGFLSNVVLTLSVSSKVLEGRSDIELRTCVSDTILLTYVLP